MAGLLYFYLAAFIASHFSVFHHQQNLSSSSFNLDSTIFLDDKIFRSYLAINLWRPLHNIRSYHLIWHVRDDYRDHVNMEVVKTFNVLHSDWCKFSQMKISLNLAISHLLEPSSSAPLHWQLTCTEPRSSWITHELWLWFIRKFSSFSFFLSSP